MKGRILITVLAWIFGGAFSPFGWTEPPSVTVFPVAAAPKPFPGDLAERVGRVIATILERAGVESLAMADAAFPTPKTDDVQEIAAALAEYIGEHPITTDYAVFAEFILTPTTGVQEIRTFIVDRSGKVHLAESAGDPEFRAAQVRPQDPMTCCLFVGRRLQEFWKLDDPLRDGATEGKMAQFWRDDAGIPQPDELDAIAQRWKAMKAKGKAATITVYPIRVGGKGDKACAAGLTAALNGHDFGTFEASGTDPALQISGHSNEQKVLWDTARTFRDFVRAHPPTTDYALYADYGLWGGQVRYVHLVLCDRAGEWVVVDLQNSHHAGFQRIDPQTAAECHPLVVERLGR